MVLWRVNLLKCVSHAHGQDPRVELIKMKTISRIGQDLSSWMDQEHFEERVGKLFVGAIDQTFFEIDSHSLWKNKELAKSSWCCQE